MNKKRGKGMIKKDTSQKTRFEMKENYKKS